MTVTTLIQFLGGDRTAIRHVAASRHAVWIGLLLVLSAGFAREHDGEDLLREPWHLLIPLAASLATSIVLFAILNLTFTNPLGTPPGLLARYRAFLGLYWMTAPLAWLYAIPVERFMSAGEATRMNLFLLVVVSIWRVILMTRIVSTLFQVSGKAAFMVVMFFADSVALTLLYFTPLPVISMMGGIRLTDSEQAIQTFAFNVGFWGGGSWLIWAIGTCGIAMNQRSAENPEIPVITASSASLSLWILAVAALLIWIPVIPFTQPEQQLRREVEDLLRAERIRDALQTMSAHERSDFPPHWDPPPRIGYGETQPDLLDVIETVFATNAEGWVFDIFVDKLNMDRGVTFAETSLWSQLKGEQFDRVLTILERLSQTRDLDPDIHKALSNQLDGRLDRTPKQLSRIKKLITGQNSK